MYELAANLTLIVHFAFILFVVFGALLFFVATKIIFIHFPALIWGSYIELTNSICPLTYLENWFLHKANLTTYSEGFIQNYLVPIVYPCLSGESYERFTNISRNSPNSHKYSFLCLYI